MMLLFTILFIALGGSLGAIARFSIQKFFASKTSIPGWIPIALINIAGSLLIGFSVAWLTGDLKTLKLHHLSPMQQEQEIIALNAIIALLAVGFCGAFTTFSTFSLDNFFLSIDKKGQMLANMIGTTALAFGAVLLGWHLGQLVVT